MSREAKVLRTEILEARREIDRLSSKLLQLEERLTELEDQGGFELVSSAEEIVNKEDTKAREEIAKSCGHFFRRALRGQPRGTSGRDRLQLQNRGYVVLADHSGRRLPEPLFTESFAEVQGLCKRGADLGDSIFLGFASKWEARLALQTAELPLPAGLRHG